MRQTTFRFELRILSNDPQSTLDAIKSRLEEVKGVKEVRLCFIGDGAEMNVEVAFATKEDAKVLHHKVMKSLIANQEIKINEASSVLTDVF